MKPASLRSRFAYKLVGNIAALALGAILLAVVPRALGPSDFGRFDFLTANFNLILSTLTLQIPVAYFNWVSRKEHKDDIDYGSGFALYTCGTAIAVLGIVIETTVLAGANKGFWPDVPPRYLWFGLVLSGVMLFYQLGINLADGRGLTVGSEKIRLFQNAVRAAGILVLVAFSVLSLNTYYLIQIGALLFGVVLLFRWLGSLGVYSRSSLRPWSLSTAVRQEFNLFVVQYTRPLATSMFVAFGFVYFDRWFLQFIDGSTQQGYFALSDRISAIAIVFTGAMTPLLTREFAVAHERGDKARLVQLFGHIKWFVLLATVIGCFMAAQSANIVAIIGGNRYRDAVIPVAILAMYPIHQAFGNLSAALLIATGRTKLYAKLSIIMMIGSLPVTYLLVAPNHYWLPGFGFGATGLAIKMVLMQIVGTNVQLYFNAKMLEIPFSKWAVFQIKAVGSIFVAALFSTWVASYAVGVAPKWAIDLSLGNNLILIGYKVVLAGIVYIGFVGTLIIAFPKWLEIGKWRVRNLYRVGIRGFYGQVVRPE